MICSQVLEGVATIHDVSPALAQTEIRGLAYDSRKVEPGFLFFAFPGAKTDGAHYAAAAIEKGAVAVVSDRPSYGGSRQASWIQVPKGREALAIAARNFYGKPDERISLTGVTGTNGKTTSTSLIDSILHAADKITALIGTIEYKLAGRTLPAVNTTPESLDLFRMFAELEAAGGTYATLEASSHALDLGRIYAMHFHTVAFTNFTRDHLDYHGTMEEYFAAKQLLFMPRSVPPPRFAVLNADDDEVRRLQIHPETEVLWFSREAKPVSGTRGRKESFVRAENIESDFSGLQFEIVTAHRRIPVRSSLVGHINVYNILLAAAVALSYNLSGEAIQKGLENLQRVPGRFERVEEGQPFTVVVDYAHTDDALRNVIAVARGLRPKRIITLFGCGGDRDRSKRPLMGVAAAEMSDYVVLTSDNPRSEDPLAIMNDAMVGLSRYDTPHLAEPDRERAIRKAIETAAPGDVVILAGKGHETYQILRDGPIPFDDREVARRVLRSFGYSKAAPHDRSAAAPAQ